MRSKFPLFQSHIDLAHHHWSALIKKGDLVIDATCGNGHDALILAKLTLDEASGRLVVMDLQKEALQQGQERLQHSLSKEQCQRIEYVAGCHSSFPNTIGEGMVQLIVYNLGYLPGGDKAKTTTTSSTLKSLQNALALISPGGAISITCYPGHTEGAAEEAALLAFAATLSPTQWSCCHHRWLNRNASPSLLLMQKA